MKEELKELQPFSYKILEDKKEKLPPGVLLQIGGTFQRADVENANKRVYPKELWLDVLQRPELKERLENRRMVGMIGHPQSGQTDPEKISHVVTKQELKGDGTVYGEADILDTPMGRIAETLYRAGIGWGISSRGDGSLKEQGGKHVVQMDYGLDTYDFVLRPSTTGAYPGMLSESTIEENEKLVAEAIAGLVNNVDSIVEEQRLSVLTECLKILSVLEAENSGNRIEDLSTKIQEAIQEHKAATESLVVIQASDEIPNPGFNPQQTNMEDNMKTNPSNPQQPQMSQDTLAWHQSQVAQAVQHAEATKDQEIASLKDTVVKGQREHTETRRRLKAAEEIIEKNLSEIEDLKENNPADAKLKKRYEAARDLLDEALTRLPEGAAAQKRVQTLESLLQASIDSVNESRILTHINQCLESVEESYRDTIRPVLEGCTTVEKVDEAFKAMVSISGGKPTIQESKEPLPPSDKKPVVEDKKPIVENTQISQGKYFVNALGSRLKNAV